MFEAAEIIGNQIQIKFSHDKGLKSDRKKIELFEISNEKGEWFTAKAKLKNGMVIVSSKEVKSPKAVRYAWKSTDIGNLYNEVGLPASTFKSE